MTDWQFSSASRLMAALANKELSSRELLHLHLDQIARCNPSVNAVVTLEVERAEREARRADDDRARGGSTAVLLGLPMTVKDAVETSGIRSTGGSAELLAHIPRRDAPAVARMRAAGAIVFGKTNVPTWSADSQTFNEIFGATRNPWAPELTAGGSSGGAAAAVACGMTPLELGTDVLGSIRIPASFCGVYGLKPSYGVVPTGGYLRDA